MLFQIYGDTSLWQLLGWALVFTGLVLANEIARRSKAGGIFFFLVLPAALSVYFIVINVRPQRVLTGRLITIRWST